MCTIYIIAELLPRFLGVLRVILVATMRADEARSVCQVFVQVPPVPPVVRQFRATRATCIPRDSLRHGTRCAHAALTLVEYLNYMGIDPLFPVISLSLLVTLIASVERVMAVFRFDYPFSSIKEQVWGQAMVVDILFLRYWQRRVLTCMPWPTTPGISRIYSEKDDQMCIVAQQTFLCGNCYTVRQRGEEGPPIPGGADMLQYWRNAGAQTGRMSNPCRRTSVYIIDSMAHFA